MSAYGGNNESADPEHIVPLFMKLAHVSSILSFGFFALALLAFILGDAGVQYGHQISIALVVVAAAIKHSETYLLRVVLNQSR